jgi:hypothetical protein
MPFSPATKYLALKGSEIKNIINIEWSNLTLWVTKNYPSFST